MNGWVIKIIIEIRAHETIGVRHYYASEMCRIV